MQSDGGHVTITVYEGKGKREMETHAFDTEVVVIGAGHAGIEAALASARMGQDTVLFTMNLDAVANLPCNPSIGGTGKGQLVFEIDALGGEMGRAADAVTLQSRTLNLGKGAAVHSKRIQADRMRYRAYMKGVLERTPHLRLVQGEVVRVLTERDTDGILHVSGVVTALGERFGAHRVIVAAGTYLDSRIFVGDVSYAAGPDGMMASQGLSASLAELGIRLRRFKTGTPARVNRRSVSLKALQAQPGEEQITPFSADTDPGRFEGMEQIPCYVVYTNAETHAIIRENLNRSAMYGGYIHGRGPRYCPSIEDKIVRFADKERHQLFVEPCGGDTEELYIQGFSTSLPTDVQRALLHSLPGFDRAEIMRYAYAIEYDCIDPTQLQPTLEFRQVRGLYGAGQFNGTSGYEEAAAQGLVAGINAALAEQGKEPMILSRASSYIGTLIDDLVIKGTEEPYRIMTSRSEHRLLQRQDNADRRLTPIGYRVGLIGEERYRRFCEKQEAIDREIRRLEETVVPPTAQNNEALAAFGSAEIGTGVRLADLLRRPELDYEKLAVFDPARPDLPRAVRESVAISVKYEGYMKRQIAEVGRREKLEGKQLPADLCYEQIPGLRLEARQKLSAQRPLTVGMASRISGVSPADISVLLIYLSHYYGK